jgi:hypothetical protein
MAWQVGRKGSMNAAAPRAISEEVEPVRFNFFE